MSDAGKRIRAERERLGLTQSELGVTQATQWGYEAGRRSPDLEYLAHFAELGADVLYVVTGNRSTIDLSSAQQELLNAWSDAGVEYQNSAMSVLYAGAGKMPIDRNVKARGLDDHDFEEVGRVLSSILDISTSELDVALASARLEVDPHLKALERSGKIVPSAADWEIIQEMLLQGLRRYLLPLVDRYVRAHAGHAQQEDSETLALISALPESVRSWLMGVLKSSPSEARASVKVRGAVGQFVEGNATFTAPVEFSPGKVVTGKKKKT